MKRKKGETFAKFVPRLSVNCIPAVESSDLSKIESMFSSEQNSLKTGEIDDSSAYFTGSSSSLSKSTPKKNVYRMFC